MKDADILGRLVIWCSFKMILFREGEDNFVLIYCINWLSGSCPAGSLLNGALSQRTVHSERWLKQHMGAWEVERAVGQESRHVGTGLGPVTRHLFYLQLLSYLFFMVNTVSSRVGLIFNTT